MTKSFASDNWAGAHSEVLDALHQANAGHAPAYGGDEWTRQAVEKFKEHFGSDVEVFFVCNGTAANVLSFRSLVNPFETVICTKTAHINVDECGAPEYNAGCKISLVESNDGKLRPQQLESFIHYVGDQHHVQPKVVSISQSTELGTVYTPAEIKNIADFAKANGLYLHMDGARLANAAVSCGCSLKALTADVGVDVLSFGGTKNGLLFGDAVVFFNKEIAAKFKYLRKQSMQLTSKMRFISAQFTALFTNDLWLKSAAHANHMAQYLSGELQKFSSIKITHDVQANGVFAILPKPLIPLIQQKYFFWEWDPQVGQVRFMTSFDTTKAEIDEFINEIRKNLH